MTYSMPGYSDEDPLDLHIEEITANGASVLPDFLIFSSNGDGTGLSLEIKPDTDAYVGTWDIEITITDTDSEKSYQV